MTNSSTGGPAGCAGDLPALLATGLTFDRGRHRVISGVTLGIGPGEKIAVIGPSGAGKTTLLRLLAGLERPAHGSVEVPALNAGPAGGRRRVGLLFQDLGLFPHMSVRRNVAYPLLARGVPRRERLRRADEALAEAELGGYGGRMPSALSGGERQRVAIVRILLSEPAVVLLDEPFASLDPHLIDHFATWLDGMQQRTSVPMALVTHDVTFAMRWADRIVAMVDGQVVQAGAPDLLYRRPATEFLAGFLGRANVFDAVVRQLDEGGRALCEVPGAGPVWTSVNGQVPAGSGCRVVVRPQDLRLGQATGPGLSGTVTGIEFSGAYVDLRVEDSHGRALRVGVPSANGEHRHGQQVWVAWPPAAAHLVSR